MIGKRLFAALSVGAVVAACAPDLPEYTRPEEVRWLDQNWSAGERFWFHHATQGTSTLPVPYEWFVALEQPRLWLFGDPPMMKDSDYLGRFGFIPSPKSLDIDDESLAEYGYFPKDEETYAARTFAYDEAKFAGNEHELPVGFARLKKELKNEPVEDPITGKDLDYDQIGFTCAACHTGHLEYNGVSLRIDGAPAVTDLDKFRTALGLSLVYTKYVPFRFGRFANRVLGEDHTPEAEKDLKEKLAVLLEKGKKLKEITDPVSEHDIKEGFARLDALNRIGNQVFFNDLLEWDPREEEWVEAVEGVKANLVPFTAPVNFPHIWDTAWFLWVQYDASIMQPMIRNAGEALGVRARINLTKPGPRLYRSLVEVGEIYNMERLLAGENPWRTEEPRFTGLQAPKWPEDVLGEIDPVKRDKGRELYIEICQGCHLPPVNDPSGKFWDPTLWTEPNDAGESYLKFSKYRSGSEFVNLVAVGYVGTDPAQAEVMVNRRVKVPAYLKVKVPKPLDTDPNIFCIEAPGEAVTETLFALALGIVVEKTADKWYNDNGIDPETRKRMNGYRPNCLQAKMIYKARPLDGIWATAPFLHNGSVPNLYELLSPVDKRSETFYLGSRLFDPEKVGYETGPIDGGFLLDTTKPGNSNKGHEFKDGPKGNGVIGRSLDENEREALIEYLKSL